MGGAVRHTVGGIRSLLVELRTHGEAITHDLLAAGWTRRDIGRRLSWADFGHWLRWLPPIPGSAYFRAKHPQSWWVTPELQLLSGVLFAGEVANWQRAGGRGKKPQPMEFPKARKAPPIKTVAELEARKQRMRR